MVDQHVYLYKNRWAVKPADKPNPEFLFNSSEAAVAYAQYMAKRTNSKVLHFDAGGKVVRIEDFKTTESLIGKTANK